MTNTSRPSQSRIAAVTAAVSAQTGISAETIRGRRKPRKVAAARWMAWRQLREAGFGYAPIARAWGCDHTSIIYAERKGWTP